MSVTIYCYSVVTYRTCITVSIQELIAVIVTMAVTSIWKTFVLFRISRESMGFPGGVSVKEPASQGRWCKRCWFDPLVKKIPWRRAWQPTPVFLPGESLGQRRLTVPMVNRIIVRHDWSDLAHIHANRVYRCAVINRLKCSTALRRSLFFNSCSNPEKWRLLCT